MFLQIVNYCLFFLAFTLLLCRWDARAVFLGIGLVVFAVNGDFLVGTKVFQDSLVIAPVLAVICSSIGFSHAVTASGCDKDLVTILLKPLSKLGFSLLPLTIALAFILSFALVSSTAVAAALGAPLIPLLVRHGIRPVTASAAILVGSFGAALNPSCSMNVLVSLVTGNNVLTVSANLTRSTLIVLGWIIFIFCLQCYLLKDVHTNKQMSSKTTDRTNCLSAIAPFIPAIIFLFFSICAPQYKVGISESMLIGVLYILFCKKKENVMQIFSSFFKGMGVGYADVYGITIAAFVFVAALSYIGLISGLTKLVIENSDALRVSASLTTFLISAVSGSNDAVTYAVNQSIYPLMNLLHLDALTETTLVAQAGQLGRLLSPFSGAALVISKIAGINPICLLKRTSIPILSSLVVLLFIR